VKVAPPVLPRAGRMLAAAGALLPLACARPEAPRGGPEDRMPPIVVATEPDTFATVQPGLRHLRFEFSERISENATGGTLNDAVLVSPAVGNVRVSHERDAIEVDLQRGLEAGQVYRITLRPLISDMFGNRLADPFDLIVSTGAEPVPNVLAGAVEDRVTGRGLEGARVEAIFGSGADSLVHWNTTDADGIFSLRFVPAGDFRLRAWQDRNRNAEVDVSEPQAPPSPGTLEPPVDTSFTVVSLIQPDTTPPRLLSAEVADSAALTLSFDDFLDPFLDLATVPVTVVDSATGGTMVVELMDDTGFAARSAAGDTAAAAAAPVPRVGLSGLPLPSQTLHAVVDPPLIPGVAYLVRVSEMVNVAGTGGGGGEASVRWEPPADTVPPDSVPGAVPGVDTLGVDTLRVDTLSAFGALGIALPRPGPVPDA